MDNDCAERGASAAAAPPASAAQSGCCDKTQTCGCVPLQLEQLLLRGSTIRLQPTRLFDVDVEVRAAVHSHADNKTAESAPSGTGRLQLLYCAAHIHDAMRAAGLCRARSASDMLRSTRNHLLTELVHYGGPVAPGPHSTPNAFFITLHALTRFLLTTRQRKMSNEQHRTILQFVDEQHDRVHTPLQIEKHKVHMQPKLPHAMQRQTMQAPAALQSLPTCAAGKTTQTGALSAPEAPSSPCTAPRSPCPSDMHIPATPSPPVTPKAHISTPAEFVLSSESSALLPRNHDAATIVAAVSRDDQWKTHPVRMPVAVVGSSTRCRSEAVFADPTLDRVLPPVMSSTIPLPVRGPDVMVQLKRQFRPLLTDFERRLATGKESFHRGKHLLEAALQQQSQRARTTQQHQLGGNWNPLLPPSASFPTSAAAVATIVLSVAPPSPSSCDQTPHQLLKSVRLMYEDFLHQAARPYTDMHLLFEPGLERLASRIVAAPMGEHQLKAEGDFPVEDAVDLQPVLPEPAVVNRVHQEFLKTMQEEWSSPRVLKPSPLLLEESAQLKLRFLTLQMHLQLFYAAPDSRHGSVEFNGVLKRCQRLLTCYPHQLHRDELIDMLTLNVFEPPPPGTPWRFHNSVLVLFQLAVRMECERTCRASVWLGQWAVALGQPTPLQLLHKARAVAQSDAIARGHVYRHYLLHQTAILIKAWRSRSNDQVCPQSSTRFEHEPVQDQAVVVRPSTHRSTTERPLVRQLITLFQPSSQAHRAAASTITRSLRQYGSAQTSARHRVHRQLFV